MQLTLHLVSVNKKYRVTKKNTSFLCTTLLKITKRLYTKFTWFLLLVSRCIYHQSTIDFYSLSSHNDWAWLIRENFRNNLTGLDLYNMKQYHLKNTTPSHTDITRLRKGQLGGQVCFILFCFSFRI